MRKRKKAWFSDAIDRKPNSLLGRFRKTRKTEIKEADFFGSSIWSAFGPEFGQFKFRKRPRISIMDIDKLKVAELRAELQSRGLDTKGTKPILVQVKIFSILACFLKICSCSICFSYISTAKPIFKIRGAERIFKHDIGVHVSS